MSDGLIEEMEKLARWLDNGNFSEGLGKDAARAFRSAISALQQRGPALPEGYTVAERSGAYYLQSGHKTLIGTREVDLCVFLSAFLTKGEEERVCDKVPVNKMGPRNSTRGLFRDWVDEDPSIPVTRSEFETWIERLMVLSKQMP